jgi:AAA family ATP:ADP antiporter
VRHFLLRLLRLHDATSAERRAMAWTAVAFFCVLFAYYLLRPLRENVAASFGSANLLPLFALSFALVTLLNQPYLALVRRLPSQRFLPCALHGFAASFVVLAAVFAGGGEIGQLDWTTWRGRLLALFYSWVTSFAVCGVTLVWVHAVEWFTMAQGKRLFGFVSVGGTLGAIGGSEASARVAAWDYSSVLLVAAVAVEAAIVAWRASLRSCRLMALRPITSEPGVRRELKFLQGLQRVLRDPYLRGIGLFVALSSVTATIFYYLRIEVLRAQVPDEAMRRGVESAINFWQNVLCLGVQLFLTSRVLLFLGVGVALCVMPACSFAGLLVIAAWPVVGVYAVVEVLRRMLQFAFDKPAREVLYTPLDGEGKYVSKAVIDTAGLRFGDLLGASANHLLLFLGVAGGSLVAVAAPLMAAWLLLGRWLGRRCREREPQPSIR